MTESSVTAGWLIATHQVQKSNAMNPRVFSGPK